MQVHMRSLLVLVSMISVATACSSSSSPGDSSGQKGNGASNNSDATTGPTSDAGSSNDSGASNEASAPLDAADFQARCAAAGVLVCDGFDDASDFIAVTGGGGYAPGLYPGDNGGLGTMDTSIKTSGASSLKFTIDGNATSNITGYWRANFGPENNITKFGPHSTLYLQFRLRVDANMLDFDWSTVSNEGWKVFIAYGPIPGPSCTGAQFVQENTYQRNVATGYVSCGTPGLETNGGDPPMLIEQGDYNCAYDDNGGYATNPSCAAYVHNAWMTEYWIVDIGDFGAPNTHFQAFIAPDGQPLKKFIDLPNFSFNGDPAADDALESILLGPYMSGADGSKSNPTASMWFDELIVSTQPIAPPK